MIYLLEQVCLCGESTDVAESQNDLRLEGTSGGLLVQAPCSGRATQSQMPVFSHPHSERVFPDIQRGFPVFQFVPIASSPVTGHHWKEPGCILFASSLKVFIHVWDPPSWAFPSPGWTVPAFSAFPHRRDVPVPPSSSWPFIGPSPVCRRLSCTGEPRTGHSTPGVASPVLSRGEGEPPSTCWQCFVKCNPDTIHLLCSKGTSLAHVQLGIHQDPQVLFCFPAGQPPAYIGAWGCSPVVQDFALLVGLIHCPPIVCYILTGKGSCQLEWQFCVAEAL